MTNIKQIRKDLKNLEYVKTLKTLTIEQRQILSKKYKKEKEIHIAVPISKISSVETAKQIFADAISEMERKLTQSQLVNIRKISNWNYYNTAIKFLGAELRSDRELIKLHVAHLQRELKWKLQVQKERERRLREAKKTNVNLTVASKKDAVNLIKHLKAKFNV